MNNTSSPLKAFKRATSQELSKWYMGILMTNLAESKDTNGAFFLLEATLISGTEPPPHVHSRKDELFYVVEGRKFSDSRQSSGVLPHLADDSFLDASGGLRPHRVA